MNEWLHWPLRGRTLPVIALIAAALLVIAGGAIAYFEDNTYRAQKAEEVRIQGEILSSAVEAALVFNDNSAAQEYVNAMRANPELEAVGVYTRNGMRFANFVRANAEKLPMTVKPAPATFAENRIIVVLPVQQKNATVGYVYLRAMIESVQRRLLRYGAIFLLVVMAALVLVVFSSAQSALARANADLQEHAVNLADTNRKLQIEMEERGKAEEALRQSHKMEAIGQLSGGIAHDFNNLLTIIMGSLRLVETRIKQGRTDIDRYVDAAMEALNRAAGLTQRILAFSRQQPLSPKPVSLSELVDAIGNLVRQSLGTGIAVEFDLQADWLTLCDANQMDNVILNLAINARDAMPGGGALRIATQNSVITTPGMGLDELMPGEYVRLTVSDTGTGMSEDVRRKAIDPFFTTKGPGQGTGLGLSMTFGYIRQSGGQMLIESELGKGTSIVILMPRLIAPASGAAP
jgi:signal transduction histidine kinase